MAQTYQAPAPTDYRSRLQRLWDNWLMILYGAALTLALTLAMSIRTVDAKTVETAVGAIATESIVASKSLTYASNVLTQKAREQAANDVQPVYSALDREVGKRQAAQAGEIFDFIAVVRADDSAESIEQINYLQAIEAVEINDDIAVKLINLSSSDFPQTRNEIVRVIDRLMRHTIRDDEAYDVVFNANAEMGLDLDLNQEQIVLAFAQNLVVPNSYLQETETELRRTEARDAITTASVTVLQGDTIVRKGQTISDEIYEKLEALGLLKQEAPFLAMGRTFAIVALAVTIVMMYWNRYRDVECESRRHSLLLALLALIFVLLAQVIVPQGSFIAYLFPATALSIIIAVIYNVQFAAIVTVAMAGLVGYIAGNSLEMALFALSGSLMAIFALHNAQRINHIFRVSVLAAIGNVLVVLIFHFNAIEDWGELWPLIASALGNPLIAASLAIGGFYLIGSVFGIVTTLQLQELSHLDHPLLQELLRRAPGTYHHSIMVANLAEQAAERVHANSTLVRVGAFYHDIGKMIRPSYFTENQERGINPHDQIDPVTSASIIHAHVTEGVRMARSYRLPQRIVDCIEEHHGDRIVTGFYRKALAQADGDASQVDKELFRYPGRAPQSRETGILMMADTIEAASSAVQPNNAQVIEELVNSLIDEIIRESQLDHSNLTMGDIHIIRSSFMETLKGRFHVRVKYAGNDKLIEANTPPVALSQQQLGALVPESALVEENIEEAPAIGAARS